MEEQLLYKYFDGCASEDEIKEIKEWFEASAENQETLRRERKLFDAMNLVCGIGYERKQKPLRKNYKLMLRECLKVAAITLITVTFTALWFMNQKEEEPTSAQTIIVPAGQRVNLLLPDGTNVWLNAGTRMTYPLSFATHTREITLDGEAYLEVSHDERCPFIVHTQAMDVKVLGTKFNVEAYSCQQRYETTLMEGKVRIGFPGKDESAIQLSAGNKVRLQNGQFRTDSVSDYNVYRWKEGLYCFRDKSFVDILKDLERYFDLSIQLKKAGIAEVTLTGKFRISEGLDYILRVLQNEVTFTYHREKENQIIIQ